MDIYKYNKYKNKFLEKKKVLIGGNIDEISNLIYTHANVSIPDPDHDGEYIINTVWDRG